MEGVVIMKNRKTRRNRLDEMQEQKLLKIEHNGCWFAFCGLAFVVIVECCLGVEWKTIAGEWIVFMCLAVYIVIGCIKNGIWDRRLEPTPKVNFCASLIAGGICGVLQFVRSYREYHALLGAGAAGIFMLGFVTVVCYGALTVARAVYLKRVERLEAEEEDGN